MFLFKFDLGHTFEHKDGLHTIIQKCEKWEKNWVNEMVVLWYLNICLKAQKIKIWIPIAWKA